MQKNRIVLSEEIVMQGLNMPLVEEFYTLQGEGYHTGKPAYFIRIGGCDIGCHWCDTKISWDPEMHSLVPIERLVANALKTPARAVVVTGGEPTNYNLGPLTSMLKEHGIKTFLETAGTSPITGTWDWICLSPKPQQPPLEQYYDLADELKVIVFEDKDFHWAEEQSEYVQNSCKLYLQSEWSRYQGNVEVMVEYIKRNPKWNMSLQAHKFMHIP